MYRKWIVKLTANARFSTICLHAGQEPDPSTGAIITPIYQTSTYVQEALGKHKGYEYARTQNPTRAALERNLAAIEGGKAGFAFASGMAAIGAIATMLKAGDHVDRLRQHLRRHVPAVRQGADALPAVVLLRGHRATWTPSSAPSRPRRACCSSRRRRNPVMRITDLRSGRRPRARHGARLVVDNTFASPCLQRPIEFGARSGHPQHDEIPERPQRQRRRRRHRRRATTTSSG